MLLPFHSILSNPSFVVAFTTSRNGLYSPCSFFIAIGFMNICSLQELPEHLFMLNLVYIASVGWGGGSLSPSPFRNFGPSVSCSCVAVMDGSISNGKAPSLITEYGTLVVTKKLFPLLFTPYSSSVTFPSASLRNTGSSLKFLKSRDCFVFFAEDLSHFSPSIARSEFLKLNMNCSSSAGLFARILECGVKNVLASFRIILSLRVSGEYS